jgi:hypothetical protein
MRQYSNTSGFATGDWLVGAVTKNPEGLLLLAAGCALLLRSGSRGVSEPSKVYSGSERLGGHQDGMNQIRTAETARQYASDIKDKVSGTASSYAESVSEYADEAKRAVIDQTERWAEQAQSKLQGTMEGVLKNQPLVVAFAGLAAGAALAATFPPTTVEQRTLGPTADRLADVAASAGKQLNKAASAAGDRLKSAAEERGLTAGGLKEMASEVAGAFESTFTGDQTNKSEGRATGSGSATQEGSPVGFGISPKRTGTNNSESESARSPGHPRPGEKSGR